MKACSAGSRALGALVLVALLAAAGCRSNVVGANPGTPAPPRAFDAWYYAHAVHLSWELDARWNEEPFRIYARRTTDPDFFLVAEVSNCTAGECSYRDVNVVPQVTYEYFVAAVDPATGTETASQASIEVAVPDPVPPPVPGDLDAIALDNAVFLKWDQSSREAADFAFYRVYLEGGDGSVVFLGETDSEGFLDLLVQNGNTYGYFVSAVDDLGHESEGGFLAEVTPRPDFSGEFLYAFEDRPDDSGFRFQESEDLDPIRAGDDPERHFRLEADETGWWLVPHGGVEVHRGPFFTTQLRCGPAADAGCTDVRRAPEDDDYSGEDIDLHPEFAYVLRVPEGNGWRYGAVRVTHVGFDQDGAIAIFDWAFQLQVDNPNLAPVSPVAAFE
jgi:hypothetical protein